jgi:asparagine synthase (glutamine-hydrolysing)
MSAIFGVLQLDGRASDPGELSRMESALEAHGRDRRGSFERGPVGLGHRLARFTLEDDTERQPVASADGRIVLVADGRVDNRAELAAALGIAEGEARGLPDSALLVRAYERFGTGCLDLLVGEFALAVWDARSQALMLATSAPLARPLCYHANRRRLAFASRPSALFALPELERRIDEERIGAFLARVPAEASRSFFKDVRRLLPGQLLMVGENGTTLTDWWRPDLSSELELPTDDDYVEAFNALFERTVADHLRARATVGIQLSGGLDSGAVAAAAAAQFDATGGTLAAYTEVPPVGFAGPTMDGRYSDETPQVRALARMHPSIDLSLVNGARGLLDDVDRYFSAAELPFRNAANRGWVEAIYERARDDGVGALLNGEQGNCAVSWEGKGLLPKLIRERHFVAALRESRALARAGRARAPWRAFVAQGVTPLLPRAVNEAAESARARLGARGARRGDLVPLINPAFAAEYRLAERIGRRTSHELGAGGGYGRAARLRMIVRTGALAADAQAGYRALYGIDTRTPLADRRLVEFCLAVPEEQFARSGESRLLIRRAMDGRLPRQTLDARLRGLQAADWFERRSDERDELLANVSEFERDGLTSRVLDLPRLRHLLEHWPSEAPTRRGEVDLYRGAVDIALMTGRFLLWAQASP